MEKQKVIFVCIHNSARSQMAEAYVNEFAGEKFDAYSAGLEPGTLNSFVVEAMKLDGIDISLNKTNSVDEFISAGIKFDYVFTVCDETSAERCPYFPGEGKRIHIGFPDPSSLGGEKGKKLEETIKIRDLIKEEILSWLSTL